MTTSGNDRDVARSSMDTLKVRPARGLSSKLLFLTILFVMIAEVLIYVPSIANFRNSWLRDRIGDAEIAALALKAAPDGMVPREVEIAILNTIGANTLAIRTEGMRQLIALTDMPPPVDLTADMRRMTPVIAMRQTAATLIRPQSRTIRVTADMKTAPGDLIEIVMDDRPLRQAMLRFSANILTLSLIISCITAALVFLSLHWLLVRPLRRLTANMVAFSDAPETPGAVIAAGTRQDEIGIAQRELAAMQTQLQTALSEKSRLAALGLAVSKINHDLRNILSTAQLISDRMAGLPDPTVQRFAPKLIATLDRAIDFCTTTLRFGSAAEAPPQRQRVSLAPIVEEAFETLGLEWHDGIGRQSTVPTDLEIDVDPDQFVRVLVNLARNSIEALESVGTGDPDRDVVQIAARREGSVVVVEFADSGPGIPDQARSHLFEAFRGSARPGGTGLGLAIAAEIVASHGGRIELIDGTIGARFRITIPDAVVRLGQRAERLSA